ncbi:MAG: UDP-4-amino-4,6-dideoxy-N-acetyl-beta-L-altrosamine N-acetyltransferase [Caulobacter sp.]|nr:UDP-4-amino-4,6-dideoxy-N-acetyl-beta-L-altrosamine N-acetyltransferase [Caulobacter sp.]
MTAPTVTLRDLTPDDSDRLFAWRNSEAVRPYMYTDHLIAPEEHAHWFAGLPGDDRRRYWIIEMDGVPVGLANLYDIDRRHGRCAWAYYLADPSVRGLGLGSFVEFWMIEQVFGPQALTKLWCEVLASNEPVWRLHEKHGFVQEARFRRHIVKDGEAVDVFGLGLLAEDWAVRRPDMAARLAAKGFAFPA